MYLNAFGTEFYYGPSDGAPMRLLTDQGELVIDTGRRKFCLSVKGRGLRLVRAIGVAIGAGPSSSRPSLTAGEVCSD